MVKIYDLSDGQLLQRFAVATPATESRQAESANPPQPALQLCAADSQHQRNLSPVLAQMDVDAILALMD